MSVLRLEAKLFKGLLFGLMLVFAGCQGHKASMYSKKLTDISEDNNVVYKLDQEYKIYYAISHTPTDLVLKLKVRDETSVAKILAFGLTVWVDSTGHGKKKLGIEYPLAASQRSRPASEAPEEQGNGGRGNRGNSAEDRKARLARMKTRLTEGLQEADLHNFSPDGPDRIVLPDRRGIDLKLDFDSAGVLLYTMKMPFKMLNTSLEKLSKDTTKGISIGFVSGKPGNRPRSTDGGGGMGSNSMGGGMGGGSGMGGGGMGGYGGGMGSGMGGRPRGSGGGGGGMPAFDPVNVWVKVGFGK